MKNLFLTLVTFVLVGTTSTFAQFNSSPAEPGLRDYLRSRPIAVLVESEKKMVINGVDAEWVSQDQVTLSAVVIDMKNITDVIRERVARRMAEYNTSAPIGTLSFEGGSTIRMIHHLNPRYVSPTEISRAVDTFKAAVEEQRKSFDKSMATR